MKTAHPPSINGALFKQDSGEQSVRLIKSNQVGRAVNGFAGHNGHAEGDARKPIVRMIHSGPDYCDLEIVCACGESTQVRCWNAPAAGEKGTI